MSNAKPDPVPGNLRAAPMTYSVERVPSLSHERILLAQEAESLNADELKQRAEAAHVDLSGATTKQNMVEAVQSQVRGAELPSEG